MNEKLQYASMLEIPVQSCNISYKPIKKKTKKKKAVQDDVKEKLLTKINNAPDAEEDLNLEQEQSVSLDSFVEPELCFDKENGRQTQPTTPKKFRFSTVTFQLLIIGVLLATIFITNTVYPNSGLNVFMRGVFGSTAVEQVDDRTFTDFAPVLNADGEITLVDGVMTISGEGSVYSTVNGQVLSVTQAEDGTFSMEIGHSEKFVSVFSGLTHVYLGVGDDVYCTIPVGYVEDSVDMCFKDGDGAVISDFEIVDDTVVWAV